MRQADRGPGIRRVAVCLALCLFAAVLLLLSGASAEIVKLPDGLKNAYRYDTQDESIVLVRRRLVELGYMPPDQAEITWINNTLKKAVMAFQLDHSLKANGKLDWTLFNALFTYPLVEEEKESGEEPTEAPSAEGPPAETATWTPPRVTATPEPEDESIGKKLFSWLPEGAEKYLIPAAGAAVGIFILVRLVIIPLVRRRCRRYVPPYVRTQPAGERSRAAAGPQSRAGAQPRVRPAPVGTSVRISIPHHNDVDDYECGACGHRFPMNAMTCPYCGVRFTELRIRRRGALRDETDEETGRRADSRCGARIFIPHYEAADEYKCSVCERRFKEKHDQCPFCGSVFTREEKNEDEYNEELEDELEDDDWFNGHR